MALEEITWTPEFEETHEFYDGEGTENLSHRSIDDYLEAWLDDDETPTATLIETNKPIAVYAYNRMVLVPSECAFLDDLIERVDDERGDPDGNYHPISSEKFSELRQLEEQFIAEFLKRYRPWACESVVEIVVPFRVWFESKPVAYQKALLADSEGGA